MSANRLRFDDALTGERLRTLQELARCPNGSTGVHGVMPGGILAGLVQRGFADRAPPDRLGGCRYVINDAGRLALLNIRPAGHSAVMAARDQSADEVDFFPTPPWGARAGAELIRRLDPRARSVGEFACGAGHMAHGLRDYFDQVETADAYRYGQNRVVDFTDPNADLPEVDWIATNPPFAHIEAFIRLGYARARRGLALLCRAAVLESEGRYPLLYGDTPLTVFAPFSERLPMRKFCYDPAISTASFYAWFLWLKGPRGKLRAPMPIPPGTRARLIRPSDLQFAMQAEAA